MQCLITKNPRAFYPSDFYLLFSANSLIRSSILFLTCWKTLHFSSSVPSAFAGPSNPQCHLVTCGGVIGQLSFASPHNVITRSALFKTSRSIRSDVCVDISTSTSFIAFTASAFSPCASFPAEYTSYSLLKCFFPNPSAI